MTIKDPRDIKGVRIKFKTGKLVHLMNQETNDEEVVVRTYCGKEIPLNGPEWANHETPDCDVCIAKATNADNPFDPRTENLFTVGA